MLKQMGIALLSCFSLFLALQGGNSGADLIERQVRSRSEVTSPLRYVARIHYESEKIYLWTPRIKDIDRKATSDNDDFLFLLTHSKSVDYQVRSGDCLDRIVRNQLFISSTDQPRAFTAAQEEIRRRNGQRFETMEPGKTISIPNGPHYGALESTIDNPEYYLRRLAGALDVTETKTAASKQARLAERAKAQVLLALSKLSPALRFRIFQRLGLLSRVYPSRGEPVRITPYLRKRAVDEIVARRILPPEAAQSIVDSEPVNVRLQLSETIRSSECKAVAAITGSVSSCVPQMPRGLRALSVSAGLPAIENKVVRCSGCSSCKDFLGVSTDLNESKNKGVSIDLSELKNKLMLEDTGIDPKVDSRVVKFYSRPAGLSSDVQVDPKTDLSAQDFSDLSEVDHGTFVYSETVASHHGVLAPASVLVARVSDKLSPALGGGYVFNMKDVVTAMNRFINRRKAEEALDSISPTWVVNLSFGGLVEDLEAGSDILPGDGKVLYVAAAGNDGALLSPNYIYPKLNGPSQDLLVVGALDSDGNVASYSNFSQSQVDIFAKGSCVCGDGVKVPQGQTLQLNGTSQAAPVVSTAATILAGTFPSWSAIQVKWRLISTSELKEPFVFSGIGGELNLRRALNYHILLRLRHSDRETENKADDIAVDGLDVGQKGWQMLLKRPDKTRVLRIHAEDDKHDKTCNFRLIKLYGTSEYSVPIDATLPMDYIKDGKRVKLTAGQLRDAILTFDDPFEFAINAANQVSDGPRPQNN